MPPACMTATSGDRRSIGGPVDHRRLHLRLHVLLHRREVDAGDDDAECVRAGRNGVEDVPSVAVRERAVDRQIATAGEQHLRAGERVTAGVDHLTGDAARPCR